MAERKLVSKSQATRLSPEEGSQRWKVRSSLGGAGRRDDG